MTKPKEAGESTNGWLKAGKIMLIPAFLGLTAILAKSSDPSLMTEIPSEIIIWSTLGSYILSVVFILSSLSRTKK